MNDYTKREIDAGHIFEYIHHKTSIISQVEKVLGNQVVFDRIIIKGSLDFPARLMLDKPLIFRDCLFDGQLFLRADHIHFTSLTFTNCIFKEEAIIKCGFPFTTDKSCTFESDFTLIALHTPVAEITNTIFLKSVLFTGSIGDLNMDYVNNKGTSCKVFFKNAQVKNLNVNNSFFDFLHVLDGSKFLNDATLKAITFNELSLNNMIIGNKIYLQHVVGNYLFIDNISNNHRHIDITNESRIKDINVALHQVDNLLIHDTMIENLIFWGSNLKDNYVTLEKVGIKLLQFKRIINEGTIVLRQLIFENQSVLSLLSSNMGKTDFVNCDFRKGAMEFENSKMNEVFVADSDFPDKVYFEKMINHKQAQLAFGQLQVAFTKQGDSIRGQEYQAREVEEHFNQLKIENKRFTSTYISLALNKFSNDFGRNWFRGLRFTVRAGALFFYLLILSTDEYSFTFPVTCNPGILEAFLKFMNPLRFFDTESLLKTSELNLTINWTSYLCDFLGRIFVAYGVYQTIQAFRRYGRK